MTQHSSMPDYRNDTRYECLAVIFKSDFLMDLHYIRLKSSYIQSMHFYFVVN